MSILKVARLGHPVLRQPARDLTPDEIRSDAVRQLVRDMHATMIEYGGVGLAAPQVHEPLRLAVIEFSGENERYRVDEAQPLWVVFNPRVTVLDEKTEGFWEGCLSLPGLRGYVERPRRIQVDYLDASGEPQQCVADGFLATVCQHEFDHLDGVLYVDRITDPTKLSFVEEYARYHATGQDEAQEPDLDSDGPRV